MIPLSSADGDTVAVLSGVTFRLGNWLEPKRYGWVMEVMEVMEAAVAAAAVMNAAHIANSHYKTQH